jgi:hypothetical protein
LHLKLEPKLCVHEERLSRRRRVCRLIKSSALARASGRMGVPVSSRAAD